MFKSTCKAVLALGATVLALSAAPAHATFILGTISTPGGFFTSPPLPLPPSPDIFSGFTTFSPTPPAITVGSCNGNFTGCVSPWAVSGFNIAAPGGAIAFQGVAGGNTFQFSVFAANAIVGALSCSNGNCTQSWTLNIAGFVDDVGPAFDSTAFLGQITGQGTCTQGVGNTCGSNISASWSASLAALGRNQQVPEPATLGLLGIALVGMGFARRRKTS